MKAMGIAQFKQQCLALVDRLDAEGIVLTKRGVPVAKVVPVGPDRAALVGALAGKIAIHGDVLTTGEAWDAQS
jgi:antitoxin (DNA-binding transcriptional repressor) of toxin-antitoxin stability system